MKVKRFLKGEKVALNGREYIVKWDLKTEGVLLYINDQLTDWEIFSRTGIKPLKNRTGKQSRINREKNKKK